MGLVDGLRGLRSGRLEIAGLLVALLAVVVTALVAGRPAEGPAPDAGDASLRASRTQVDALAGHPADLCVHSAPGRHVCRWRMSGRVILGEEPVQTAAIHMVCDLPKHTDDGDGPCAAVPVQGAAAAGALPAVSAGPPGPARPDGAAQEARAALRDAADLMSISRLVGDVPEACRARFELQECRWALPVGSPGHALLAALAETPGPVALACLLPLDGRPRSDDACRVLAARSHASR